MQDIGEELEEQARTEITNRHGCEIEGGDGALESRGGFIVAKRKLRRACQEIGEGEKGAIKGVGWKEEGRTEVMEIMI